MLVSRNTNVLYATFPIAKALTKHLLKKKISITISIRKSNLPKFRFMLAKEKILAFLCVEYPRQALHLVVPEIKICKFHKQI